MIIIISAVLIFTAICNIWLLRRRRDRLQTLFNVEVRNKSIANLIEDQLITIQVQQSLFKQLVFDLKIMAKFNYRLLTKELSKVRLIVYVSLSTIVGIYLNLRFVNFSNYIVIPFCVLTTIYVICSFKRKKLKKEFYDTFPEALNIVTGLVSSGYAVTTTFKNCGESVSGIVGEVMKEVNDRFEVGDNTENVLMNSYLRLPFAEYYFFILTVLVNLDSGSELQEIFNRLGKMLTSNRILAKFRDGKTSELRMTMWILGAMPFLFILVLRLISVSNYNILMYTKAGHYLLYYVVGSVVFGFFLIKSWINKII